MLISFVEIENFRRLEAVRVDFDVESTLLVGPNNSGKSSVISALAKFLNPRTNNFRITDFTLDNLRIVNEVGEAWTRDAAGNQSQKLASANHRLDSVLPTLDIWLSVDEKDLLRLPQAQPNLEDFYGAVGVRLRLEPKNIEELAESFLKARKEARERTAKSQNTDIVVDATQPPATGFSQESPDFGTTNMSALSQEILANPRNLVEFLDGTVGRHFEVRGYLLSATEIQGHNPFPKARTGAVRNPGSVDHQAMSSQSSKMQALGEEPDSYHLAELRAVIQVDEISATRGITEGDSAGRSSRLSNFGTLFNRTHFQHSEQLTDNDRRALQATQDAVHARNNLSAQRYQPVFDEISALGYPGGGNPGLVYEENVPFNLDDPKLFFRHKTDSESGLPNLDESLNGLGYQSLIYMAMLLIDFRKRRMSKISSDDGLQNGESEFQQFNGEPTGSDTRRGVSPIHLVLIEEPEAFLHAQVQQVFIRQAMSLLRGVGPDKLPNELKTQIVVSTHSSHVVQQVDFSTIRYLRRQVGLPDGQFPASTIANLTNLWDNESSTKGFVSRYVRLNHCNMFFADALVLVEGAAERILLPEMIARYENLNSAYLEILEVGGSHAHRLQALIDCLGVPTLVVTDMDAGTSAPQPKKARPSRQGSLVSKNYTLKKWLRNLDSSDVNDLSYLLELLPSQKLDENEKVRFAFQTSLISDPEIIPSTFEDALILENLDLFDVKDSVDTLDGASDVPHSNETKQFRKIKNALQDCSTKEEKANELWTLLSGKKIDKAAFALELLMMPEPQNELKPPQYISEGLSWLNDMLDEKGLLILKSTPEPPANREEPMSSEKSEQVKGAE